MQWNTGKNSIVKLDKKKELTDAQVDQNVTNVERLKVMNEAILIETDRQNNHL